MTWFEDIAQKVSGQQTINDSKTPSGRVHVGALRGVLIHDALFKAIKARGTPVRYLYGVDDYDPLDELPAGQDEHFSKYLGVPLCNVPPPPGSTAPDMAMHFISEFFDIFKELDVHPEIYHMRDVYRSGRFDAAMDAILSKADVVRQVYYEVSGSKRPDDWYPFQAVCENCGRIGTTQVTAYDGKEVTYVCRPDMVKWAVGCGHRGKVSPFGGRGKLPWKLEWVAKWKEFPVTIEGAGKDHSTRGGSRDVSGKCYQRLFGLTPPLNVPYEFFLVGGAKMSSSRGVGASARDMANLLPPELLRFLMMRTPPARAVNFSPEHEGLVRLFSDYDRLMTKVVIKKEATEDERQTLVLSQVGPLDETIEFLPDFDLVLTLVQMPHIDTRLVLEQRKGSPLNAGEARLLDERIACATTWLNHFATEDQKLSIQPTLPEAAQALSQTSRAFLHRLADGLAAAPREPDVVQTAIFNAARMTPIAQPDAFKALYRVLLNRDSGPKAGNLLAYLDRDLILNRLRELPVDEAAYFEESAIDAAALSAFFEKNRGDIVNVVYEPATADSGFLLLQIEMRNGQTHARRLRYDGSIPDTVASFAQQIAR
jgi:lysyl-tRNA synthetase class 1